MRMLMLSVYFDVTSHCLSFLAKKTVDEHRTTATLRFMERKILIINYSTFITMLAVDFKRNTTCPTQLYKL